MLHSLTGWLFDATQEDWTIRLLHVCAVGQTAFLILWFSLPWWRLWVGRALMVKSLALGIFLDQALVNYYLPPYPHERLISTLEFALIAIGIVSQLVVIAHEIWRSRYRADALAG